MAGSIGRYGRITPGNIEWHAADASITADLRALPHCPHLQGYKQGSGDKADGLHRSRFVRVQRLAGTILRNRHKAGDYPNVRVAVGMAEGDETGPWLIRLKRIFV